MLLACVGPDIGPRPVYGVPARISRPTRSRRSSRRSRPARPGTVPRGPSARRKQAAAASALLASPALRRGGRQCVGPVSQERPDLSGALDPRPHHGGVRVLRRQATTSLSSMSRSTGRRTTALIGVTSAAVRLGMNVTASPIAVSARGASRSGTSETLASATSRARAAEMMSAWGQRPVDPLARTRRTSRCMKPAKRLGWSTRRWSCGLERRGRARARRRDRQGPRAAEPRAGAKSAGETARRVRLAGVAVRVERPRGIVEALPRARAGSGGRVAAVSATCPGGHIMHSCRYARGERRACASSSPALRAVRPRARTRGSLVAE